MQILLQIIGGSFYLLNKILLSRAERSRTKHDKKYWETRSWLAYLLGLPAWVIIFIIEKNYIAAFLELGGAPSMILGLWRSGRINKRRKNPVSLNVIAILCIMLGIALSVHDVGSISTLTQYLEITLVVGYLVGTYLLAMNNPIGYIFFMIMNLACGYLMYTQGYFFLAAQQAISLYFVCDAFFFNMKRRNSIRIIR